MMFTTTTLGSIIWLAGYKHLKEIEVPKMSKNHIFNISVKLNNKFVQSDPKF